jgi:putative ABC transport system ATP-binding protein
MEFISVNNLTKQYGEGEAAVKAVSGMNFTIGGGEFVAIMGESGSGKSTLLSMMGGLCSPTEGQYLVDGIEVYALGQDRRADFRREFLGFVFQNFNLIPYLTVVENVMLPLATLKLKDRAKSTMATNALARVGLEGKMDRLPNQISGGEQERVAIARAVVNEPPILLADEPTGNLDTRTGLVIMDQFKRLNSEGMTILMVTHSADCANYSGRVLSVADGMLLN